MIYGDSRVIVPQLKERFDLCLSDPPECEDDTLPDVLEKCRAITDGPTMWLMPLMWVHEGSVRLPDPRLPEADMVWSWTCRWKQYTGLAPILVWDAPDFFVMPDLRGIIVPEFEYRGQKPAELFLRILKALEPESVLDPFAGRGVIERCCNVETIRCQSIEITPQPSRLTS